MIKKYKEFIKEGYNISQKDTTELASGKNYFNDAENNVKEFLNKKTTVDNIYASYRDEKDLISKLSAQKFIPINTSDKSKIKFTNPLIGMYAQSCEKKRELKSLEDQLTQQRNTLSDRQSTINKNPDTAESLKNDISYTQSKISELGSQISKLKSEILSLEKDADNKLKEMKNSLNDNKKKLDHFIIGK